MRRNGTGDKGSRRDLGPKINYSIYTGMLKPFVFYLKRYFITVQTRNVDFDMFGEILDS